MAKSQNQTALTPAMRQYQQYKAQYPEFVLFFRMGDFYEMFWEDAELAHKTLGVTLTSRSKSGDDPIPMAGVPFHSVEGYLRRMIAAGHRVAICEQTEDASQAKGVIRREVTRLVTPGTLTDEPLLDGRADNYLAAVASGLTKANGQQMAIAWTDLSTGVISALSGNERQVLDQAALLRPAEVLIAEQASGAEPPFAQQVRNAGVNVVVSRPGWQFSEHHAQEEIHKQWQVSTVAGFGFDNDDPALFAIGAILSYLQETQKTALAHLRTPSRQRSEDHLAIDGNSWRSLEIDRTVRSLATEGSLLSCIDHTQTAMGSRLLRRWLRFPLCDLEHINARQLAVAALIDEPAELQQLREKLSDLCDIERILGRVAVNRALPRDLAALGDTLAALPQLVDELHAMRAGADIATELVEQVQACSNISTQLAGAMVEEPPSHLRDGGVFRDGYDAELDRLRSLTNDSQKWLAEYQKSLMEISQITSLKVGYNKVFGYYIEVTDAHRDKVPSDWTRRQTVKNAERYVTDELRKFEQEILSSRDRAISLEQTLFEELRVSLLPHVPQLQDLAASLARLDVLAGLAFLAHHNRYCRPTMTDDRVLQIVEGRHPVLDEQLGTQFVSNDLDFRDDDTLHLITGPNMAGKSTYIRQVALIVLLAQIGAYVPAKSATIGIVDRLFTRIGASDELHSGQSTFMVEMVETANILNNATDRSLVVLDEIGRGTSTLDGLALAWAICEHIAAGPSCRTLFATHYHELTDLADQFAGVRNFNVAVREWEDQVIFLHRIVEGGAERSYGIHVARLAGVPREVVERANLLLGELAVHHVSYRPGNSKAKPVDDPNQLMLFADPSKEVANELRAANLDELTPMQAFDLLRSLREKLGE